MFTDRLGERDRKALYDTAAEGAQFLDSLGHAWWLSHGTLLGAWRHEGLIPWDDDLDLAFPRRHASDLQAAAESAGWCYQRTGPFCAKIWKPERAIYRPRRPWTWPFIDIAFYDEFELKIIIEHQYHTAYKVFHRKELLPTRLAPFGPLQLPIPQHPERMLNLLYPCWSTRPTSSSFCHRGEARYREPAARTSIRKLAEKFPLFHIPEPAVNGDLTIYYAQHPEWSGPLHFFADGRMCRPGIDEGTYQLVKEQYVVIHWDRWKPDALVWRPREGWYQDLTKPFALKPMT